ncbi:AraC family transcriptional regulator, L-rhamnose operon transcriptional activator RhaR [Thermomonospora echinospora]|uniref:AraC family transcriptional regulator, L-rhamnose operon transcriptional activator RhaR n=1 Tax=Thermomonospora echinospora TaxID=1992 RepID=A0A1H6DK72_9ACTN|nr:AraC family transcriptional regulator [Thermomonospora echinospora]SEG85594.1 AraC family transcriptional regulator, L-rhamnose operon transcriptional activator RhaR [Thermomonospora echinospora]
MNGLPVDEVKGLAYITDGSLAYAGHHLHEEGHPVHTHSFVEIAVVTDGQGVHRSLTGRRKLEVGDVILLRPGVWHGYEECRGLDLYNCCFNAGLLQRELAWTREDPLLGYLLWTGPNSMRRRGILTTKLDAQALKEAMIHLDALAWLRHRPMDRHRADTIGRLSLFLGHLARAVAADRGDIPGREGPTHPAVLEAMHLLETRLAHKWTLSELADELHLTPRYLIRLFKEATGLPPMTYLAQHRVEKAASLLLHTDQPITQIGQAVGWADQNYFARRFKAHYGLTATTYRQRFTHSSIQM